MNTTTSTPQFTAHVIQNAQAAVLNVVREQIAMISYEMEIRFNLPETAELEAECRALDVELTRLEKVLKTLTATK